MQASKTICLFLFSLALLKVITPHETMYHNAQKEIPNYQLACAANYKNILIAYPIKDFVLINQTKLHILDSQSLNILKELEFSEYIRSVTTLDSSRIIIQFTTNIIIYNFISYEIENYISWEDYVYDISNILVLGNKLISEYTCNRIQIWNLQDATAPQYYYYQTEGEINRKIIKLKGQNTDAMLLIYSQLNGLYAFDYEKNETQQQFAVANSTVKEMIQINTSSLIAMSWGYSELVIYDLNTESIKMNLRNLKNNIKTILQIEGSNRIVCSTSSNEITIWNSDNGELLVTHFLFYNVHTISFLGTDQLALGLLKSIKLISLSEQNQATQIIGFHQNIASITQLEGTNYIATVGSNQFIKIWNYEENQIVAELNVDSEIVQISQYKGNGYLVATTKDGGIILWNYEEDTQFQEYLSSTNEQAFCSVILEDSDHLLLGQTNSIISFNLTTFEFDLTSQIQIVNALSIAEVNNDLIISNFSHTIFRVDKSTFEIISSWQEDSLSTTKIVYSSTYNILVITGYYGSLYTYNVSNNYEKLHQMDLHKQPVFGLQVFVSGSQIISSGWDNNVVVWDFLQGTTIKQFKDYPSDLLLSIGDDLIISADKVGIIEKFSKNIQCNTDESELQLYDCGCSQITGEILYLNDTDQTFLTCSAQTNITFEMKQESLSTIFLITYNKYWEKLITSLVNSPYEHSNLTISGLEFAKDFIYEFYTFNQNSIVLKLSFITEDLTLQNNAQLILKILSESLESTSQYFLLNKTLEFTFSETITLCNPGFYEKDGECIQSTVLYPSLAVTQSSNTLKLKFINNKTLSIFKQLSSYISVVEIVGYSAKKYNYHVVQESDTEFLIKFTFFISILDGPKTTIKIDLPQSIVYSNEYTVNPKYLSVQLMKNSLDSDDDLSESLGSAQSAAADALVYATYVSCLAGNAQALSSFFILGLIQLLKFQKINYSSEIWAFFKSKEGFLKTLLAFVKMPEESPEEISSVPDNLKKYNFSCYFWNNHYKDLIIMTSVFALAILINFSNKFVQRSNSLKNKKKFMTIWDKVYNAFVWNLVYMVTLQAFLNGLLYSFTQLFYTKVKSALGNLNYVISLANLVVAVLLIAHIFIMVTSMKALKAELQLADKIKEIENLQQEKNPLTIAASSETIANAPQSLHFKPKNAILAFLNSLYSSKNMTLQQKRAYFQKHLIICGDYKENVHLKYNLLQYELIRLLVLGFIIITLIDYPLLQTLINILALTSYLVVFIHQQVGKFTVMKVLQVIVEIFIVCSYAAAFLYSQYDINGEGYSQHVFKTIQLFILIGIFGITYIQLGAILISIGKSVIGFLKKAKAKISTTKPIQVPPQK